MVLPTPTAKMLLRSEQISDKEWFIILENLRERMKPFLKEVTLVNFLDFEFLESNGLLKSLSESGLLNYPTETAEIDNLKTQGIFFFHYKEWLPEVEGRATIEYTLWGIARSGEWVLAKAQGHIDKDKGNMISINANLKKVSLEQLFLETSHTPYFVWRALKRTVEDWTRKALAKAEGIQKLKTEIVSEEPLILHFVTLSAQPVEA